MGMTREEAISWIEKIIEKYIHGGDDEFDAKRKEALRMGISALSQEPCEDAISRDAVKELIKCGVSTDTYDDVEQVCKWIDALPPVTQKSGKWIPFSERLPKPFEHCLITTTDGEVIYHYDDGHYSKYKAWMPLPKPYEPQESEDKE